MAQVSSTVAPPRFRKGAGRPTAQLHCSPALASAATTNTEDSARLCSKMCSPSLLELSDDIGCRGLLVHAESAEAEISTCTSCRSLSQPDRQSLPCPAHGGHPKDSASLRPLRVATAVAELAVPADSPPGGTSLRGELTPPRRGPRWRHREDHSLSCQPGSPIPSTTEQIRRKTVHLAPHPGYPKGCEQLS
jgi:hypothetical protein